MKVFKSFKAYEWVRQEDLDTIPKSERRRTTLRWKDGRKPNGLVRSRWALQNFVTTAGDGEYLSPSPHSYSVEMLNICASSALFTRAET